MEESEIVKFSGLLRDIGTGKRDGFIFIVTTDGEEDMENSIERGDDGLFHAEGITFGHHASLEDMAVNLIINTGVNPLSVALASMEIIKSMGKEKLNELNPVVYDSRKIKKEE